MNKIDELIEVTVEAINRGSSRVILSVPHKKRKTNVCYPLGKGTPKAYVISYMKEDGKEKDVVEFDAIDLLAFLVVVNSFKED